MVTSKFLLVEKKLSLTPGKKRYYKMSKFLRANDKGDYANGNKDDSKAVAIPRAFSENSRAKNEKAGPNQTLVMDQTRFIYTGSLC